MFFEAKMIFYLLSNFYFDIILDF